MKPTSILAALAPALALTLAAGASQATELKRDAAPGANIATSVLVPAGSAILFLAGMTPSPVTPAAPGTPAVFGDTKTQTISALTHMVEALKVQGMTMGDVATMRVYLVADPAKGGVMDFAGMNEAYKMFFANKDQPNQPARATVQVVKLANPAFLVEIEAYAAKAP